MSRHDRVSNLRCVAYEMWSCEDTDREWEVLGFILDALSTEQMTEQLGFATKHRPDTPARPVHPARRAHSAPGSRPDDSPGLRGHLAHPPALRRAVPLWSAWPVPRFMSSRGTLVGRAHSTLRTPLTRSAVPENLDRGAARGPKTKGEGPPVSVTDLRGKPPSCYIPLWGIGS